MVKDFSFEFEGYKFITNLSCLCVNVIDSDEQVIDVIPCNYDFDLEGMKSLIKDWSVQRSR